MQELYGKLLHSSGEGRNLAAYNMHATDWLIVLPDMGSGLTRISKFDCKRTTVWRKK
jgi:hypothetical protein